MTITSRECPIFLYQNQRMEVHGERWFGYELCVPEPPEVSEIMDGSCLIRIKPMTEEQREMSERCVRGLISGTEPFVFQLECRKYE